MGLRRFRRHSKKKEDIGSCCFCCCFFYMIKYQDELESKQFWKHTTSTTLVFLYLYSVRLEYNTKPLTIYLLYIYIYIYIYIYRISNELSFITKFITWVGKHDIMWGSAEHNIIFANECNKISNKWQRIWDFIYYITVKTIGISMFQL